MMNSITISEEAKAEHAAALAKMKEIQKKNEWLEQRKGRFTSSEYGRLMGYEDNPAYQQKLTKGGITYAYEKYLEAITTEKESISSAAIEHGNEFEAEAAERFMEETGIELINYGKEQEFIPFGSHLGCTPDGLIGDLGGFESKCPNSKTHDTYLNEITDQETFKAVCNNYYWQIQGSMYVTNRKFWYFVSYDPRMRNPEEQILILKVERNEKDIENLKNRLQLAIGYKLSLLKKRNNRKPLRLI